MKSKLVKTIYIILAFFFVGLGILGIVLPILPTTPFLLLASYFFAKGSERFHIWFTGTKLYKNHLEEFIESRAMILRKKLFILLPVSTMLIITAIFINNLYARVGIAFIMVFKYYYFFTHIRTLRPDDFGVVREVSVQEK